jgi:hypothetical protein
MGNKLGSTDTLKSKSPVEGTAMVTKSDARPSNQAAPQDQEALTIKAIESKTGSVVMVTCPTCGAEAVAESSRPDIHKLSGRAASRRYLRFKIDGANLTLVKLHQAEIDLKEKFAKADQKARDLAFAKAETLEKLAKTERSRVEAEMSKVAAIHYQDPMDVDNESTIVLSETASGILTRPVQTGTYIKISTEESQAIRKSNMVGGKEQPPFANLQLCPMPSSLPHPQSMSTCSLSFSLR